MVFSSQIFIFGFLPITLIMYFLLGNLLSKFLGKSIKKLYIVIFKFILLCLAWHKIYTLAIDFSIHKLHMRNSNRHF